MDLRYTFHIVGSNALDTARAKSSLIARLAGHSEPWHKYREIHGPSGLSSSLREGYKSIFLSSEVHSYFSNLEEPDERRDLTMGDLRIQIQDCTSTPEVQRTCAIAKYKPWSQLQCRQGRLGFSL